MKKTYLIDQSEEKEGLIYFIGNNYDGPIKIGFTSHSSPIIRLRQLQTASPYKLNVLGFISGTVATEKAIHSFLQTDKIRGEWFKREPALAVFQHLNMPTQASAFKNKLFEKFWIIATSIEDEELTNEEMLRGEDESVVSIITRHILLDKLNTFRQCHAEKPLPLLTWLIDQYGREDAIGDLAKDACDDYNFPAAGSVFDYVNYIANESRYGAEPAVTRTIIDAWIECQQVILSIK